MKNRKRLISLGLLPLLLSGCNYGGVKLVSGQKFNKFYEELKEEKNRTFKLGDAIQLIASAAEEGYSLNENIKLETAGYENWEKLNNGGLKDDETLTGISYSESIQELNDGSYAINTNSSGSVSNAVGTVDKKDEEDPDASYSYKDDTTTLVLSDSTLLNGSESLNMSMTNRTVYQGLVTKDKEGKEILPEVDYTKMIRSYTSSLSKSWEDDGYKYNQISSGAFSYDRKDQNTPIVAYSATDTLTRVKEGEEKIVTTVSEYFQNPDAEESVNFKTTTITTYSWIAAEGRWDEGNTQEQKDALVVDYDEILAGFTQAHMYQLFKESSGLVRTLADLTSRYQGFYINFSDTYKDQDKAEILYQYGVYQHRAKVAENEYIQHSFFAKSKSTIEAPTLNEISLYKKVSGGLITLARTTLVYSNLSE